MTDDLRIHLPAEGPATPRPGGEFVLYWMQTTHRAHDNFALNFAVEQANQLGLPVLVYHGLRHDYPWASDRFHSWILESVVDLYADFAAKGIQYAFWLSRERGAFTQWPAGGPADGLTAGRPDSRQDKATALVQLADRAALVVTDHFPTFIAPRQTRGLRRKTRTPVIAVESCTVVPLRVVEKGHSTARGIRPVLMNALEHFFFPVPNPEPRVQRRIELPFDPVRPTAATIPALVASCDIDHTVPPSRSFRGGTRAGRTRLQSFLETGLPRYDERNDPNELDPVSRLSPWLHFGNLSIHEVLLGVMGRSGGAEQKLLPYPNASLFVDQAVVWRELAHNFCHYDPKHRTTAAIPAWAQKQLADHESDPRPHLYSIEEMEQARTGEELWNAAQRWYLYEGWMHNYMRMLWGKTVLQWTPNAAEALRVLEQLNNRYSLDGRDPNSYGGIMWIFGKFDRPFYPRPIYGNVRYMSLKAAKGKFDVARYVREAPR